MTDNTEKDGVVIDVTPEPETETTQPDGDDQKAPQARKASSGSANLPLVIAGIALLLVLGSLAFGINYTRDATEALGHMNGQLEDIVAHQNTLKDKLRQANVALEEQQLILDRHETEAARYQTALDAATANLNEHKEMLADERGRMEEREAELRASVADVHRRVGRSGTQWMISEAEYLMRVAHHRLTLSRDTGTASSALQLADQRLLETQDPGWNPVREQIARDIIKLDAAKGPDEAGISARLSALSEQIPQLKLANTAVGPDRTLPESTGTTLRPREERSWDTLLSDLWSGFQNAVRIRRRDKPVQAMLAPEQQYFLYENLRLHVEAARLALARNDKKLYADGLATASRWLTAYFDPNDALTQAAGKAVTELAQLDIRPELPDISKSLRALQVRKKLLEDMPGGDATAETQKAE